MAQSFGEPLTKLRSIPIQDNGEKLIDPSSLSRRIQFAKEHPVFKDIPRTPLVRETVAKKLLEAVTKLPEGIDIVLLEGYRPVAMQRRQYNHLKEDLAAKHSDWSTATLNRVTNTISAPPDDRCPPPHTTGAALDVYLIYADSGEMVDMTSPYEWDAASAPTAIKGLSEQASRNRQMLLEALESTGLTNYAGEWWHWSYGDSGWALRVGAPVAVYDRIREAEDL